MAIDSANKRLSAINAGLMRIQPFPNGSLTLTDRVIVLGIYAHDSFPAPVIITKQLKVASISLVDQFKIGDIEFVC